MEMGRCFFAWGQMVNRTFYATVALFVVFGIFEAFILPHLSLQISGIIRVLVGAVFLGYYLYWLRFYYKMYETSSIVIPVDWTDLDHPPSRQHLKVLVGHRRAFEHKAKNTLGPNLKPNDKIRPNAILYSGDILVVADGDFTYKEMRIALRTDFIKRGSRWNNNFSFYDGTLGFLDMETGRFHNIVRTIHAEKALTAIAAK